MKANLKILILEDNQSDADLLHRELKRSGMNFISEIVQTREEFENALQNFSPDIILSDYSLPSFDADTAFHIKQIRSPHIPFIIVSGIIGEEKAVELIKNGVTDFTPKDKLFTLSQKIIRALKESEEWKEKIFIAEKLKMQAADLIIANKELVFQNDDKENRAFELNLANKELAFQNDEKENRAAELILANIELAFQNDEKENRAAELIIANIELAFQNEEKEKRAADLLILSKTLKAQQEELRRINTELNEKAELLIDQEEKVRIINQDLMQLNQELEERVARRTKALAESESRFRNMMETIPQIAWTNTDEGEVTFCNQRWFDYTALDINETREGGWQAVIHPEDMINAYEEYRLIQQNRNGGEFQIRGKRSDGDYRWHLVRIMPIKNDEEEVQLWVGTATDIHELRLLQQQKDDFISIASHELKTPVTSLKASLQLLDRMKDNPSSSMLPALIGQANKSLQKVSVLIEDILNASKVNEGQLHLNQKLFVMSVLVDDCCNYLRLEDKYTIRIEGDMELQVYADADRISQIVINFVNNAIKYAPDSKEIRIKIEKILDMAKVSVSDEGQGISNDKLSHLFDRYYRVDESGTQYSGLGLGLYISSEIIKKHKGQIGVESELGKGSTFWVTLPLS